MPEVVDVVGQEGCIIGERDAGDGLDPEGDAKLRELCQGSLLVVVKFILVRGGDSSLLQ